MRRHGGFLRRVKKHRLLATVLLALLASTSAYAYTTDIGGVDSTPIVGSGSADIGGYTLGSVSYTLNLGGNSNQIVSVSFTLSPTPSFVRVSLGGAWHTCSGSGTYTCTTTGDTATGSVGDNLTVAATG